MKSIVLFIGVLLVGMGLLGIAQPKEISSSKMLEILQQAFPAVRAGETLLVTTGRYTLPSIASFRETLTEIYLGGDIPPCAFKAATVFVGELHQRLDSLIAAGFAMGWSPNPPWFVVFLTNCGGWIRVWGFNSLANPQAHNAIWEMKRDRNVLFILI